MKAMILAAGRGERMRPLTDTTPKPLLKVAGKALIEYHLESLQRAGVHDVVINHAWLGEQITDFLGDGSRYEVRITYSPESPAALETAGGIIQALPLLGDEPFILVNGDIWSDYPFASLSMQPGILAHLVMVENPEHNPGGDFAMQQGLLNEHGNDKFTYSGMALYHPRLFAGLAAGVRPLAPLLKAAMQRGEIGGEFYSGRWYDIGTVERLEQLERYLAE